MRLLPAESPPCLVTSILALPSHASELPGATQERLNLATLASDALQLSDAEVEIEKCAPELN